MGTVKDITAAAQGAAQAINGLATYEQTSGAASLLSPKRVPLLARSRAAAPDVLAALFPGRIHTSRYDVAAGPNRADAPKINQPKQMWEQETKRCRPYGGCRKRQEYRRHIAVPTQRETMKKRHEYAREKNCLRRERDASKPRSETAEKWRR